MGKAKKKVAAARTFTRSSTVKARSVDASQQVNHRETPIEYRWKPGQSGNPSGRPSAPRKVIVDTVKEILAEVHPKLQKSMFERLLEQAARRALQGSYRHLDLLLAYGLGKPLQQQINVNREITQEDRIAGMTDEEITTRLLELTVQRHRAHKNEGEPVQ